MYALVAVLLACSAVWLPSWNTKLETAQVAQSDLTKVSAVGSAVVDPEGALQRFAQARHKLLIE